jgi:TonB family protein
MRRIRFFWLLVIGLGSGLTTRAELRLLCEVEGRPVPIVEIERGRILGLDGGKKIAIPEEAVWRLDGDLGANADLVQWAPSYSISRVEAPDYEIARMERPFRGAVKLQHMSERYGEKHESLLFESWPEGVPQKGIAVLGWVVDGKVVAVQAKPVPATAQNKYFEAGYRFALTTKEAAGQGIVLLWINGRFVAPVPIFKEPRAQQALVAALLGDESAFRAALAAGTEPRSVSRNGRSLLSFAAEAGNVRAVDVLLAAGARVNAKGGRAGTPLAGAARNGRLAVVERLLAADARLDNNFTGTLEPLPEALAGRFSEVALRLVDAEDKLTAGSFGDHLSVAQALAGGMAEVLRKMLERAGPLDFKEDRYAQTLIVQALRGHTEMVKFLVEKGVSPDFDDRGETALMAAASCGDPELIRFLIQAGAKVNRISSTRGTALGRAAERGRIQAARALLDAGALPELGQNQGPTALHHAARARLPEMVGFLLENGADPRVKDERKASPLDIAIACYAVESSRLLAAKGAKLDLSQPAVEELLAQAIALDLAPVVDLALKDGWKPETKLYGRWPALQVAMVCGAAQVETLLRKAGAPAGAADFVPMAKLGELDAPPRTKVVRVPVDPRDFYEEFLGMTVEVDVVVDESGKVRFQRLYHTSTMPVAFATVDALADWQFVPLTRGGKPVAATFRVPVEFPSSRQRALELAEIDVMPVPKNRRPAAYPRDMRNSNYIAEVLVSFVVTAEGKAEHIRILSSPHPSFQEAAVKAVSQWTFKPALRDGVPVNVRLYERMPFAP